MSDEEKKNGSEDMTFRDKVLSKVRDDSPNRTLPITFPRKVFKRFNRWAFENASDCYWLAIEKLLDNYERRLNLFHELKLLADRDDVLASELQRLNAEFAELRELVISSVDEERRTFGKKGEKNGN